jgi:hypothetical protein
VFKTADRTVAIAWRGDGQPKPLKLVTELHASAYDVMGNELKQREIILGQSPVYLIVGADKGKAILDALSAQ